MMHSVLSMSIQIRTERSQKAANGKVFGCFNFLAVSIQERADIHNDR